MSRIFDNSKSAFTEITRDLFEMGTVLENNSYQNKNVSGDEKFFTKELLHYSFSIIDTSDIDNEVLNLKWCKKEFEERVSSRKINPGEAWKERQNVWEEFLNKDGKFCYTYNERIRDQTRYVIDDLANNPNSRQAIIQIHNRDIDKYNYGGKKRMPCSMYYQFLHREGKLDVIYNMRSSDLFTHFRNDIWFACKMRDYIARILSQKPGRVYVTINSLHAFKKDFPEGVF